MHPSVATTRLVRLVVLLACILALASAPAVAQPEASRASAIRVFVDCGPCDETFLRIEITFEPLAKLLSQPFLTQERNKCSVCS